MLYLKKGGMLTWGQHLKNEILEIFGTTDLEQLKKISRDVASYNQKKQRNISGRKNSFTEIQAAEMVAYTVRERVSQILQENIRFHVRQSIIS